MASKTVFMPHSEYPYVKEIDGYRNPKAIEGLDVLEISTRSKDPFGKSMSPFNLEIRLKSGKRAKVECLYQGSKVIEGGLHYPNLYWGSPRDAALFGPTKGKRAVAFKFFNREMPLNPKHAFFNWLYICSLCQRKDNVFEKLDKFDGFSDIFYSPRKDPNCQARAASIYISLIREGLISEDTPSQEILDVLVGE